jgi:hypothetical protein
MRPVPDTPPEAVRLAAEALCDLHHLDPEWARTLARAALDAAAPVLADKIASAILRYADENEPEPGSAGYPAWHRHFESTSAVAAKSFGRDNLEGGSPPEVPR